MWRLHKEGEHEGEASSVGARCPLTPVSCSWGRCEVAGEGTATLEDGNVASGTWKDGLLEGKGNMSRGDGGVVRGYFTKGCLGGLVTRALFTGDRVSFLYPDLKT